jgi:serine/threonine-protein kinase RsbW
MSTVATTQAMTRADVARVRLTFPAKPEYITLGRLALTGLARLRPLPDELLGDLKLALTEACTNCVKHAYPDTAGSVEITYELGVDRIVVEVADDGLGFDYANGDGDARDLLEGGLGIAIIRALADEFELGLRQGRPGSRLRFVKFLPEP